MAEIDVKKLREFANRAVEGRGSWSFGPKELLALCDRLEAAERERDELMHDNAQLQSAASAEATLADEWRSKAEAAEKDAARYRFLRNEADWQQGLYVGPEMIYQLAKGDALDAVCDSAFAQRQGEGS
ncbi:hypothetical protein [Burkholderia ubonensis]|uniref:hypothetical protein n=1 Tax=Burkholderia ubonensis TaxID=101571 RepID=UPI000752E2D3|nr:hypothetical protein [Burkholderia ubonensis]